MTKENRNITGLQSETQSDYFKIARAVDGDDWWITRLKTAFEINGIEPTREKYLKVTKEVVAGISCLVDGTVSTEGVTDEQIDSALLIIN